VEHDLGQRDMGVGEGALLLFRHSREAQRAAVGRRGLLGSAGLLVFASSFGMAVLAGPAAADSGLSSSFPVWLLFAAFLVADRAVVPIYPIRGTRSQISFSLTEMPLVFALLIASPVTALAARVVAGLMVMLREGRRDPAKFAFNLSAFALDTGAPLFAYHVVLGGPPLTGPWGWAAAFVAVQSGAVLSALLIQGAIFLSDGPYPVRHLRKVLGLGMLAAAVNTALGLVAVVLLLSRPSTIFLLLPVAGLAFVAYRGYSRLSARHEMMTLLHGFTQRVGQPLERGATSERLLHEAAELMRAEFAELVLVQAGDDVRTVERVRAGGPAMRTWPSSPADDEIHGRVLDGGGALLLQRGTRVPAEAAFLVDRGIADAIVVALTGEDGVVGVLCVGERVGLLTPFNADDLRLAQTVANHASALLENGRLVERLREELAVKEHRASHDALTGLPNRTLFQEQVGVQVAAARAAQRRAAVMLLDLDRFKEINDTLGHHVGDDLLKEVGCRLRGLVGPDVTVARLGGDEFALLVPRVADAAEAERLAGQAVAALGEPFDVGQLTLVVGASMGIALAPDHSSDPALLLQRADVAMYLAKASHAGAVVYDAEIDTHSPSRLALIGELRRAIDADALMVHFQPKADVRTGEVVGAEALVRWLHPTEGLVSPEEFIPIAERTGMIHELTGQVLRKALLQCAAWRRGGARIDVAVNLSVGSLLNLDLPAQVQQLLDETSVAPSSLTLELTEGSIMADPTRSIRVLSALSAMGVRLAIDDFGTGYSSLSQLKRLPVDELKIDRSFIIDMTSDDDDAAIVRSTVELGHNLGLRVVAEGVQDAETWRRLRALGCDVAQGYYLSRAVEPVSFGRWLTAWNDGVEQRILPPADERRREIDASRFIDLDRGFDAPL
jgi:diguanylate cyclase (GGDEF)-like protein